MTGIELNLIKTPYNVSADDAVDPSAGFTLLADKVKFDVNIHRGILGFSCGKNDTGSTLDYVLEGENKDNYEL